VSAPDAPVPPGPSSVGSGVRAVSLAASAVFGAALLALVVATPLDLRTQAAFAAGVFVLALLLGRWPGRGVTLVLVLLSLTVSARYLAWRLTNTIATGWTIDAWLSGVLLVAELYAFAMLGLGYFQSVRPLRRRPVPLPQDVNRWPTVDVLIPTFDEPLEVVRATVLAARAIDWPAEKLSVHLLDDGRRPAFREFAARAGIGYVTRSSNVHAKAGNLNHTLLRTRGEFVAVFDCDHVPTRAFLQLTMGWFLRDERVAVVQTPHHFYTPDPFERNLGTHGRIPNESQLFYGLIQRGNDLWDAAFFCGSCAVLRRAALEDVGGFAVETVTEDAHTALRLHARGWRSAYLDLPLAAGLATETLAAHVGQRRRWARGMAQIFRLENPLLKRGLGLWQRLCYSAAMLHFLSAVPRLIYLTAPAAYLLAGRHLFNAAPMIALAYALPHLAHVLTTNARLEGGHRQTLWSEVYDTLLAPYTALPTTMALLDPRLGRFGVTAKGRVVEEEFFDAAVARPGTALALLNLASLAIGAWKLWSGDLETEAIVINMFWALHNLVIVVAGVAVALERQQTRECPRIAVRLPATLQTEDERALPCETANLGRRGAKIRLSGSGREFRPGERVWLSIRLRDEDVPLPAAVVADGDDGLRLRFGPLALDEESHLVQAMFSRADAWMEWGEMPRVNVLRSMLRIAWYAGRGVVRAVVPASPRPVASAPHPAAASAGGARARHVRRLLVLAVVWAGAHGTALGRDRARAVVPRPEDDVHVTRVTRELGPSEEQRGGTAPLVQFAFPVRSDRVAVQAAVEIAFDASQRMPGSVEVLVNRERVALLDPDRLARERDVQQVEIPPHILSDRNVLALRIVADEECAVDRGSWQFLKAVRVLLATRPLPLPDNLAMLPLPFVDREHDAEAVIPLVIPPDPSPARLRAAAVVASWFGVNNGLPLRFRVHLGELPASRAIVLVDGAPAAVALGLPPPQRGTVQLMDHPQFPGSNVKLLVLAGRDAQELERVVNALAAGAVPLAGATVEAREAPQLPRAQPYDAPRFVPAGRVVPLGKYPGVESLVYEGTAAGNIAVRFRVPPDLWLWPREHVALDLGYEVTTSGDPGAPRLDVAINGKHLQTLPPIPPGDKVGRVHIQIPRELLRGFNDLRLHVRYPDLESRCRDPNAAGRVAISPDSALRTEELRHFARLPDVSLFIYDGFPFTRTADLADTAVVLPDRPRPEEVGTVLSVIAQLGAITGRVGSRVTFVSPGAIAEGEALDKDLLVVGVASEHALLRRWASRLPLAIGAAGSRAQLPAVRGWLALLNPIFAYEELRRAQPIVAGARELVAVMGIDSPLHARRSAVVVTATSAARMPAFTDMLGFAESRSRVNDVLVITDYGRSLFRIGPTHGEGEVDVVTRVRWAVSNDWLLLLPALFAGAALVAGPTRRGLERRARARLGGEPEAEEHDA
jgi:cellulose synthase (UDP-forming)